MNCIRRITQITALILLIAACSAQAQVLPQITVSSESIDFGNVRLGDTVRRSITITNTATIGVLTGTATTTRGYYLVDSGAAFALGPNTSAVISVRFIPTRSGAFSDSLAIAHNAPNRPTPLYITLRANVDSVINASDTSAIAITPASVDFGSVKPGQVSQRNIVLRNTTTRQIAGVVEPATPPFTSAGGTTGTNGAFLLAPGQSDTVTVRFAPTANGTYADNLPITYVDSGSARTKYVALRGVGDSSIVVLADSQLTVQPSSIDYGNVPRGESFDRTFSITNTTSRTITGNTGTSTPPFATVVGGGPFTLAPGEVRNIVVRFTPATTGSFSDSVVISYVDTVSIARTTRVLLMGRSDSTATPADTALVVTPTFLEFGEVAPGSTETQTFTISNVSTRVVQGLVGAPGAPYAVTAGAGPFVLAPGAVTTVTVQFAPTAGGEYSSAVPVTYLNGDTTGARTVYVFLHGVSDIATPTDTLVEITPGSIAFGPVNIGQSLDRTLQIRNRTTSMVMGVVLQPTGGGFVVTEGGGQVTLAPGQTHTVTVRFAPIAAQSYTDSLMIMFTDSLGQSAQTTSVGLSGVGIPPSGISAESTTNRALSVSRAFPNPTSESVRIDLTIGNSERVIVEIYDATGARIETLIDTQLDAGSHSVTWTPTNVPAGSYVYRVRAGGNVVAGQVIYTK